MSQEKEINYIQTISVCRWQHPIYRKTLKKKDFTKKLLNKNELCKVATLRETYGDMADCCEKQEPERNECFLKHKDDSPDLPKLKPEPDTLCAEFKADEKKFWGK